MLLDPPTTSGEFITVSTTQLSATRAIRLAFDIAYRGQPISVKLTRAQGLAAAGIPMVQGEGGAGPVPVPGRRTRRSRRERATSEPEGDATHLLPLTLGDWCAKLIVEHLDGTPPQGLTAGVRADVP